MEKTIMVVLGLVALAAAGVFFTHQTVVENEVLITEEVTMAEEMHQTANRAEKLLGTQPSEDATHLLQFPEMAEYTYAFAPAPQIEYLIHVEGDQRLGNREVVKIYEQLQEEMGGWFLLYGRVGEQWTIPRQKLGATIMYDELVVSTLLVNYEGVQVTREELKKVSEIGGKLARELGLEMRDQETVDEALERANVLADFWNEYNQWILLVLEADSDDPYTGKEIHDVALSLGLEWDEESLSYNWLNEDHLVGDTFLFSVGNLADSDLVPEEMVKEDYTAPGLIFGFYLPISGAPKEVYANMLTAVQYTQERLGGTIQSSKGRELDADDLEWIGTVVESMTEEMTEAGYTPGHNLTMWLYESMLN